MRLERGGKRWRGWRRLATAAAMVCVLGGLISPVVRAETDAPVASPELVARVTEFFKKVGQARRPRMDERMATEIQDIAKTTDLGAEGVKSLQTAAVAAADAAQAEQLANQIKQKPTEYAAYSQAVLQSFDQPDAVQEMASAPETIAYTGPTEQPVWKEALARALTPAQLATWEKTRAERTETTRKEIDTYLDARLKQYRPGREEAIVARGRVIIAALNLPKERADAINALATKAADASMDRWRENAVKMLLNQSAAQRTATFKSRGLYFAFQAEDAPEKLPVWTEGLAKLLSDEERARMQTGLDERKTRRVQTLTQLAVAVLDEKVAFTTDQRPRLEPLAARLVPTKKAFFPEAGESSNYNTFSPSAFYQLAADAKPEELQPVLDEIQRKHWLTLKDEKAVESDEDEVLPAKAAATSASPDASGHEEPEDLEQAVSDYIQARTAMHQRATESVLILQAEDATRVAGLAPENAARLQTAARGAAETATDLWVSQIEQTVRSAVQGATRENLQQKLGSIGSYYFSRQTAAPEDRIWAATVKSELTPPQQAAWQAERDAREQYHDTAIAQYLTMGLDERVSLNPEQWKGALSLITKAFHDYRPDIERMFSYANNVPWYLSSYYMFMPLHGIPEEEFKRLLTKEQWDQWSGSSEFSNTASYWDNIKDNHESRMKEQKDRAGKEKKKP